MTTITALPTPPQPNDPVDVFNAGAFAFWGAMPQFRSEVNDVAIEIEAWASAAANSELAAELAEAAAEAARDAAIANANAAAASAGATAWVSGTTYAAGARVWSPINQRLYARIALGAGTTDPSADAANWAPIWPLPKLVSARSFYL